MVGRDMDEAMDTRVRKKVLAIYEHREADRKLARRPVLFQEGRAYVAWRGQLYPLVANNGPRNGSYSLVNPSDAGRLVDFQIT